MSLSSPSSSPLNPIFNIIINVIVIVFIVIRAIYTRKNKTRFTLIGRVLNKT